MTPVLFTLTPGARHGARPVQHGHAPALDRDSRPLRGRGARRRADARATHACRAPERGWPLRHAATYGDSGGPPCRRCLSLFLAKVGTRVFTVFSDSTPTHSSYWLLRVLSDDRCQPRRGREEASQTDMQPECRKTRFSGYRLHSVCSVRILLRGGAQPPAPRTRYS